jgi:hypothetical protein
LSSVCPKQCKGVGIFIVGQLGQQSNAKLEVMSKTGVELGIANEFCHITGKLRGRPSHQKSVLGFGRPVAINTHVDSNELEALRKKNGFCKGSTRGGRLGKLSVGIDIFDSIFLSAQPTNHVIDNDSLI